MWFWNAVFQICGVDDIVGTCLEIENCAHIPVTGLPVRHGTVVRLAHVGLCAGHWGGGQVLG